MTVDIPHDLSVWALGLVLGLGLTGLAVGLLGHRHPEHAPSLGATGATGATGVRSMSLDLPAVVVAIAVGASCAIVTGWPVAVVIGGARLNSGLNLGRQTLRRRPDRSRAQFSRGDDRLAASAGLGQAIVATAELSPAPIRTATERLAAQIQAGVEPRSALLRFADDVGDPCADRVVCALLLAFSARAQRLGDLLSELAESTREEVALRLRVETSRASVRSGVRTVVVFSVVFAGGLALLARPYLSPFDSSTGQAVLLVVGGLYAAGLTLMVALARPPKAIRLLGTGVVVQ
jgi:tight adherence protein B